MGGGRGGFRRTRGGDVMVVVVVEMM